MATYTEHYNLIKPALNDKVNINNLNDNADIIDNALYDINDKIGKKTILATATADGIKTLSAMLDELYPHRQVGAIINVSDYVISNTRYTTLFGCVSADVDGNPILRSVTLKQSGSIIKTTELLTGTITNQSANVPISGTTIELYIQT